MTNIGNKLGFAFMPGMTTVTLRLAGRSAPFSGINVRNGLRETPVVPGKVFNIVLPFAVRVVRGFPNNPSATSSSVLEVSIDVLDPHHDCSSQRDIRARLD
ncbi:MAG: hypothetical protein WB869_19405 [Candidatus Acidiferrales bacterium]